jgi:hypothetical protein
MSVANLGAMRAVAERLDRVGLPYAFVGGSVVNLPPEEERRIGLLRRKLDGIANLPLAGK